MIASRVSGVGAVTPLERASDKADAITTWAQQMDSVRRILGTSPSTVVHVAGTAAINAADDAVNDRLFFNQVRHEMVVHCGKCGQPVPGETPKNLPQMPGPCPLCGDRTRTVVAREVPL